MILSQQNITLEAIKQESHATDTTVIYLNSHANTKENDSKRKNRS